MTSKQTLLMLGCAPMALILGAAPAAAQDVTTPGQAVANPGSVSQGSEAGEGDAIIVTGSRIRQNPLEQRAPVVVVDQEAIAKTGLSAVADVLQRLPSAAGGLNTKVNNSGNIGNPQDGGGVGAGSAEIDLRYLLAKRTLVLVDGLRYVPGASASGIPATVDLNSIPTNQIDRIEVLQSGQSPLYGSDAIAGVVNIITKSQQQGLQADAQFGTYRKGDGHTYDFHASYGFKGPTTSVVVGGYYSKQEKVSTADRSLSQFPFPGETACTDPLGGCSSAALNGRFVFNPGNPSLPAGGSLTQGSAPNNAPTRASLRAFTAADRFNFSPYNYFLTPLERYGGWMSAKQELGSDINLRVKAVYNRRNSQNQAAFLPLFIGPDAGNGNLLDNVSIDATNPYNPFGTTLDSGKNLDGTASGRDSTYSFIARRLVEAGQRTYTQRVDTWSVTGTLDGKIHLGDKTFYWDVNAVLGFNDAHQTFTGNVNAANVARALGPVANCVAPCVPLNLFGGAGSITQEMLNYIGFTEKDRSHQRLEDYTANLSGDIFDLPAGPVGVAIGYEHRDQLGTFTPDPIIQAGLGADIPAQAAAGRYNSDEVYAEARVPILKDTPFFQSLDVDGAVRHVTYSGIGSNTTYTGQALWKPVKDILLRGSYAKGFRAPSLGELFGAQSRTDAPVNDPCTSAPGGQFQSNATVRANCIANGVPASGSYAEAQGGQTPTLTGGNDTLKPETSRTLLFGAVYSPEWARNSGFASSLSLEVNYYDIKVKGAIAAINPQITLSRCAELGDPLACSSVIRTQSGIISRVVGLLQNIGQIRTKGIDATLSYRSPQSKFGQFGLSLNGNYLDTYKEYTPTSNGFLVTSYKGHTRGFPDQSYPKFKGTGVVSWDNGPIDASFTARYIHHVTELGDYAGFKLKSKIYGDAQIGFVPDFMDSKLKFTVGVINVFNTSPPPCFSCTGPNYDPTTYDVPGQFGYVRVSYAL